ncbi:MULTISPECIES: Ku protein [unclassified Chitinophaga]|uniref:non-homologous end joining protein Ku n=1 Tax=unclassified Chitinophaga TaxID=2619133 RepID=UPI0009C4D469|nr:MULTISPECIES: Ku protein [unclassified Chitinophaga]OMP78415.1 Ku protein [[Flexibacter] sp. ATCC 35208]WPV68900.1 Ku protein [Chitinophaga sp. LS1]
MRAIWSGTIGFGLVNIPVKLYSAVKDSRLDLDMLDKRDQAHIKFHRVNEDTGKEVPWDKIVKGYLYNDEYIILEDEDFEAASPEKTKMITIESFVEETEIDDIYFETPYFIEPEKSGTKAYALLLKTLEQTGKAGIGRFVLRTSEHIVVIRPRDNYLLLHQLRFQEEIRTPEELTLPATRIQKKELDMAVKLVESYTTEFDISQFKDEYHAELLKIIKQKASGKKRAVKKMKVVHTKSTDLFSQLKASLGSGGKRAS